MCLSQVGASLTGAFVTGVSDMSESGIGVSVTGVFITGVSICKNHKLWARQLRVKMLSTAQDHSAWKECFQPL